MRTSSHNSKISDERKKKRMGIIIAIILISILVFSSAAYFIDGQGNNSVNTAKEYGQKFSLIQTTDNTGSYWQSTFNNQPRKFVRLPTQVEYIEIDKYTQDAFDFIPTMQSLVVTFSAQQDFAEITREMTSLLYTDLITDNKQILAAITNETEGNTKFPVISCDNQSYFDAQNLSGKVPIIQIQEGNETLITTTNNCIIVQGLDGEGIISAVERLRYGIFGLNYSIITP